MSEPGESRERAFIDLLRKQIEGELKWGPVQQWTQRDFQNLSQLVEAKTREHLGITTLKRILGRVTQKGLPYLHTLNILAQYLGYENWIDFKKQSAAVFEENSPPHPDPYIGFSAEEFPKAQDPEQPVPFNRNPKHLLLLLSVVCAGLLAAAGWLWFENESLQNRLAGQVRNPVQGTLQSDDAISDTFPHQVHFTFFCPELDKDQLNVIAFEPGYMKYISVNKQGVCKVNHLYSQPGFYNVKVFSNRQTVATKQVLIGSGGWKGTVRGRDGQHLGLAIQRENGTLKPSVEDLAQKLKDTSRRFHTSFYYYNELSATGENCRLKIRLRNTSTNQRNHDRTVTLRLWGENDYHMIQLAKPFQDFELFNRFGDLILDSATTSPEQEKRFIRETRDWFDLEMVVVDKHVRVFYNQEKILDARYKVPIGNLAGVEVVFVGKGELDSFYLYDHEGNPVVKEDF